MVLLFIGCQEYRGYFDKGQARTFAEELQGQELDVSVKKIYRLLYSRLAKQILDAGLFLRSCLSTFLPAMMGNDCSADP
ncbi:MAG: hypothetical protein CM1200mP30_18330 [Pseudomonadota bacterium]|nr:MAG: hypothetical protein CM1200mP30_18330 [Pseudomonadota bacterium]